MKLRARVFHFVAHFPVLLVAWANALFIWNHFHARAPYWHDAGWFSGIVWRAGIFGRNPPSPHTWMPYYWGWHPSLLVSAGSLLSYVFPGDRVDWYCVFQAAVYAPLAFVVPILVPEKERTGIRAALVVAVASIAFSFGGQVVSAMAFPHFEIFSSAGISIMLAALAVGRRRLAWVGLAMSIATREDGGYHAGSLLAAVVLSEFLGRPFPIARKRVLVMFGVALGATIVLVAIQKKLFITVDAWEIYLAGKPAYAHLTKELLANRLARLFDRGGFIWMPFALTVLVAIIRRDARYLLGWLATLPWFVLNICALQPEKGEISTYTGFPFVAGAFWAAAYARACDRRPAASGWRWPVLLAGSLGAISLLGYHAANPVGTQVTLRDGLFPAAENPGGVRAFARELRERGHGRVRMDLSAAAWALEAWADEEILWSPEHDDGIATADGYAFFATRDNANALAGVPFTNCGRVARSLMFFCTRSDRPLPSSLVPSPPMVALASIVPKGVHREGETIVVDAGSPVVWPVVYGPYARYLPGRYVAAWDLGFRDCPADASIRVDVARFGRGTVAERDVTPAEGGAELGFEVLPEMRDDVWEFRMFVAPCAVVMKDLRVRRLPPSQP